MSIDAASAARNGHSDEPPRIEEVADFGSAEIVTELPNSIESEQSTLGAMLLDSDAVEAAQELLDGKGHDFFRKHHRAIYGAIIGLQEQGRRVDWVTVAAALKDAGSLEEAGGAEYVLALTELCPSAANVCAYAENVRALSNRRRQIVATEQAHQAARAGNQAGLQAALESLETLADATSGRERFALLSCEQVEALEPPEQLIDGLLTVGGLGITYGPPGSYKSFLALDMALHIATGREWHGRAVKAGPVVYVAAEGASGLGKRVRAWRQHHQAGPIPNFHTITEAPQLMQPDDVAALLRQIRRLPVPPVMVVLDTLARCVVGGEENSNRDIGQAVDGAAKIQKATGAHVQIIHHSGKDGALRGASCLPGAADTQISVRARDGYATLECEKQKDAAPFAPITFARRIVGQGQGASLVFELSDNPAVERELSADAQIALGILQKSSGGECKETWRKAWEAARTTAGIKCPSQEAARKAFDRARLMLEKAGKIRQPSRDFFEIPTQEAVVEEADGQDK